MLLLLSEIFPFSIWNSSPSPFNTFSNFSHTPLYKREEWQCVSCSHCLEKFLRSPFIRKLPTPFRNFWKSWCPLKEGGLDHENKNLNSRGWIMRTRMVLTKWWSILQVEDLLDLLEVLLVPFLLLVQLYPEIKNNNSQLITSMHKLNFSYIIFIIGI